VAFLRVIKEVVAASITRVVAFVVNWRVAIIV
jgi:hypothetical protein